MSSFGERGLYYYSEYDNTDTLLDISHFEYDDSVQKLIDYFYDDTLTYLIFSYVPNPDYGYLVDCEIDESETNLSVDDVVTKEELLKRIEKIIKFIKEPVVATKAKSIKDYKELVDKIQAIAEINKTKSDTFYPLNKILRLIYEHNIS